MRLLSAQLMGMERFNGETFVNVQPNAVRTGALLAE
jgi:hypothetical protein